MEVGINQSKSKIIHLRKHRKPQSQVSFSVGNTKIDHVQAYRYLGVTFDEHLSFNEACQELIYAGGRALGGIMVKFKQYKHIGFNCFTKLFETGVEIICTYCSGIWGYDKFLLGQKFQLRALRYFLGVPIKVSLPLLLMVTLVG